MMKILIISIYLCIFQVFVCVWCVHLYTYVCRSVHMQKPEVDLECLLLSLSTLFLEMWPLSIEPVVHQLSKMGDQTGSFQFWITHINRCIHLYHWCLGSISGLHDYSCKHFPTVPFPLPTPAFTFCLYIIG